MAGSSSRVSTIVDRTLRSIARADVLDASGRRGRRWPGSPALATSTSTSPACSARRRTSSVTARSARTVRTSPPRAEASRASSASPASADHQAAALTVQPAGDGGAEPARCSRDQGDPAIEVRTGRPATGSEARSSSDGGRCRPCFARVLHDVPPREDLVHAGRGVCGVSTGRRRKQGGVWTGPDTRGPIRAQTGRYVESLASRVTRAQSWSRSASAGVSQVPPTQPTFGEPEVRRGGRAR